MEYIKAYSGNDSYIFISYAHRDTESVLPIIKNLINNGYRTWYDEGIEPGKSWDDYIADHVLGCSYFIAFVSPSYLASSNCMDELNFARDENKKLLLVYLSPVDLPAGMRMRLNRLQAINKYTFENEEKFFEKLFSADGIDKFQDTAPASFSSPSSIPSPKSIVINSQIETLEFENYTYTGETLNGNANGRGIVVWRKDGSKWQGEFLNNKPVNGNGVWYREDGIYIGKITNANPNGFGKIEWTKGGEWEGEWKDGETITGKGTTHYSNGNSYCGELKSGKANGYGKIIWVKGGHWEGTWKDNNIINGKGTYYYSNGDVFIGDFKEGKPHGYGMAKWARGGKCTGSWINGEVYDGNGTIYKQGNMYTGNLKNGKADGFGTIKWALGGEWQGRWQNDLPFNGNGTTYFYKDGVLNGRYEGEIRNGQCNGIGTLYWATTNIKGEREITGEWLLSGEWRNHKIYRGEGHAAPYEKKKRF